MTTGSTPPASRVASWLVGCLLVGWVVAYNLIRVGGAKPADAAWPALGIGAAAGLVVFVVGLVALRRLAAAGRVVSPGHVPIPAADRLDEPQRDALRLAWPPLAALAALGLIVGLWLAFDWFGDDSADRPTTTLVLAAWNLLIGLWLGDEALRLRRPDPEGIESVPLGCGLTAVLAGVGLSRDLAEPAQVALIVVAGVAGALAALAVWRLRGAHGPPLGAAGVALVALLSLILPLAL
ncbi:hypothetical protein [Miltoncostaea marina]|uniref:hypothetical protein n=1 Tax=Miltoncostaea marina TaxID=2843215 RepID=UPI001C3C8A65|nr:hypothetical protein [Miltoncostaea marina]